MATLFGKYIRKLRIDTGEVLGAMADAIGVSSAYLSAVENGKKKVTPELIDSVIKHFSLNAKAAAELRDAAEQSPVSVKIDLQNASDDERQLVSAFARRVQTLSAAEREQFMSILTNNKDKDGYVSDKAGAPSEND